MSSLAQLLEVPEVSIAKAIAKLEDLSGYPSQDVRLLAEMKANLRSKVHDLKLDPNDTTAKELYHALLGRLEKDISHFDRAIFSRVTNTSHKGADSLAVLLKHSPMNNQVWALKISIAKQLLRQNPPRRLMKLLHYRSLESMLKRQNIGQLYGALPAAESAGYLKNLSKSYSRLGPDSFENRNIEFVLMSENPWRKLSHNKVVSGVPQVGVIAIWLPPKSLNRSSFTQFFLILGAMEELRLQSLVLKLRQTSAGFSKQAASIFEGNLGFPAQIASQKISWSSLHQHLKHQSDAQYQLLEPYLHSDDFNHPSANEVLADLHPAFRWWQTANHTAAHYKDRPVSLNLLDVFHNHIYQLPYKSRTAHHFQQSLWDELIYRYLKHPAIETHILDQLDNNFLQPETVSANVENYLPSKQPMVGII